MSSKIALLIDAENMSYKELPHILKEVSRQGQITLQAVYGDWERPHLQKWHNIAEENDFHIRHQTNNPNTKNSTDMKLIMDAMEVLYRTPVDCFCLVTNDADYIPLCDKIREARKIVIGIGYEHASEAFIRSCDQFIFIRNGKSSIQPPAESLVEIPNEEPISILKQPASPKSIKQPDIQKLISKAFAKASSNTNQWVALSTLGMVLREVQAGFQTDNYGHATLKKLLQSMPNFVELQVNGNGNSARLKDNITVKRQKQKSLQKLVSKAFAKAQDTDGWVTLSALGLALRQVEVGFKTNTYGHATLSKLLQSMSHLVEIRVQDGIKSARLKK